MTMSPDEIVTLAGPRGALATLPQVLAIGLLTLAAYLVGSWYTSPLRKYPGPFLAGFTNLYRLSLVLTNRYHEYVADLHEKYGPVVRIGPNALDLDVPELIKTLYGTDNRWIKTKFYHSNSVKVNGELKYNIFSTPDQAENARIKRPIAKHYSASSVLLFEPHVDTTIKELCRHLEERFIDGPQGPTVCDLGSWIAYCTWDIVGTTTYSKPFGYMEKGCDFDHAIENADKGQDYFAVVGQLWQLDSILDKNPIMRMGPPNLGSAIGIASERYGLRAAGKDANYDPSKPDYLALFLEAQKQDPDMIDGFMIVVYSFINVIAGADTTATTVRAAIYLLLMHPDVHERLKQEVRAAQLGEVADYKTVRSLSYLDAVMKESMRVHPGVAMMLERYVPDDGLRLPDGSVVPPRTEVGINPYVVQRNRSVYGDDAHAFRPERWLRADGESEGAYEERMKLYARNDLTFGAGARTCLGRHLAMLEGYKLVATLVDRYDMEIENGGRDYTTINRWFFRQKGLLCRIARRA